jgi:enoyl-CoA hydratase
MIALAAAGLVLRNMRMADADIRFERRGHLGLITLNRPKALNTLTLDMVRALDAQLRVWATDPAIATVAIRGEGRRAFCAGGDIRALYDLGVAGKYDEALQFWRDEYPLNTRIKEYPKPYVALVSGFVMGGGAGVAVHGSHRVAVGEIAFAMPEVGIGFFPDVGATFFLPRLPAGAGLWLALTGRQLGAADALALGIMTDHVRPDRLDRVIAALGETTPDKAIAPFRADAGHGGVREVLPAIGRLFSGASVEGVLAALDREAQGGVAQTFAEEAAALIRQKSPTSLKIAFEQMRRGRRLDFRGAMRAEFHIASKIVRSHDLYEGIRAVVVDKDNAPQWRPPSLAEVSDADVEAYFDGQPAERATSAGRK